MTQKFNSTFENEAGHILGVQVVSLVLSVVLGLTAGILNSFLLLTIYKDPLQCFQRRSSTVFIQSIALVDLLNGVLVQTANSILLAYEITKKTFNTMEILVIYGSHVNKISILTLIVLSIDRLIAVAFPWKNSFIITRKRAWFLNLLIWTFVVVFEASSHLGTRFEVLHQADVHLQTTVPLVGLLAISTATVLYFKKHSRNAVLSDNFHNQAHGARNVQFEKRIMVTILLILLVVIASLTPYLVTHSLGNGCYRDDHEVAHGKCNSTLAIFHVLSVSLLCISSAMNPVLYCCRIPQFRQSFIIVFLWRRSVRSREVRDIPIPSIPAERDGDVIRGCGTPRAQPRSLRPESDTSAGCS